MNRLKFRAWNEDTRSMLSSKHFSVRFDGSFFPLRKFDEWFPDKIHVMQFTGLLDKNGKEIYEGDVVQWLGYEVQAGRQIRPPRVIIVGQGYFPPNEDTWHGIDYITDCYHLQNLIAHGDKSVEILGNIYDHSHLLNVEE